MFAITLSFLTKHGHVSVSGSLLEIYLMYNITGLLHEDLRLFLETNVPASKKKQKVVLGICDSKIGATISEELGISCQHTGIIPEIARGTYNPF